MSEQSAGNGIAATGRRNGKNRAAVEQFNRHVPEGSPVLFWPGERVGEGRSSRTRSKAWIMGGHTPVVMVDGYAGGIALSHVCPLPPGSPTHESAESGEGR
jgi:hypothetical protein